MDLIERFLANMEVGVGAFTSCDIRSGYKLTFDASSTATLHYCLAGRGAMTVVNGSTIRLRQHSFVLLPPGTIYSIGANINGSKGNLALRRLRAPLFKESVPTILAGEGKPGILTACGDVGVADASTAHLFARLDGPIVEHFDGPDALRNQFIILLAEFARPAIGTRALTEALLKQCLILLLRRMIARGVAPIPWMAALTDPQLARALEAILVRPSQRFTVETLASIAGMSRSAFAARFTEVLGQTPMSLLKSARLHRARELLATTNAPVAQIARSVGFLGRSNFSRAFRKAYGVHPTSFRAALFRS
ncbi:MAG TPA: AraC family transcriptional regulator [Bryobacteraceae bacterium]